jgi:hypothetical protein
MRPFLLLLLAISVTGILAPNHANAAVTKERWEGYRAADSKEVKDLKLPFQEFAENAVFEMETIGATRTEGERFEIIPVTKTTPKVVTDPELLSSDIRLMQIETCRKQELQSCPVLSYSNRGTVFFNRGRFVTCRHGFHNWLSVASQLNGNISVSDLTPPMILRNSKGVVVYNSAWYEQDGRQTEKEQMKFSTINDDPRLNFQTFDETDYPSKEVVDAVTLSDYTEMKLSKSKFTDFALTERTSGIDNLRANEETYLVGYKSQKLVMSNGYYEGNFPQYSMMQTSNYSNPGMSGGAIITPKGELAGVHCMGLGDDRDPSSRHSYSYPVGNKVAKNFWRTIAYPSDTQLASIETQQEAVSQ